MIDGYRLIIMSDVFERDGIGVELCENSGRQLAEVFHDDTTKRTTFTMLVSEPLDFELIGWLVDAAREEFLPEEGRH